MLPRGFFERVKAAILNRVQRAKCEAVSSASLVRQALRAYGVTPEHDSEKSAYEVIEPLMGKLGGGPADLSSNPAYLDDWFVSRKPD